MHDLILACAAIAGGVCGLISIRIKGRRQQQQARLLRMSTVELHTELIRFVGAIAVCARKGDKRGMWHAYRTMKSVIRVLAKRKAVHAAS